jgi:hypothetical protein
MHVLDSPEVIAYIAKKSGMCDRHASINQAKREHRKFIIRLRSGSRRRWELYFRWYGEIMVPCAMLAKDHIDVYASCLSSILYGLLTLDLVFRMADGHIRPPKTIDMPVRSVTPCLCAPILMIFRQHFHSESHALYLCNSTSEFMVFVVNSSIFFVSFWRLPIAAACVIALGALRLHQPRRKFHYVKELCVPSRSQQGVALNLYVLWSSTTNIRHSTGSSFTLSTFLSCFCDVPSQTTLIKRIVR